MVQLDVLATSRYYPYANKTLGKGKHFCAMNKQFEGRSLAHPGCLIGITAGLIVGIVLAGVLASVFNMALNAVLLVWLGVTIVLGILGWVIGERLSMKFFRAKEKVEDTSSTDSAPST